MPVILSLPVILGAWCGCSGSWLHHGLSPYVELLESVKVKANFLLFKVLSVIKIQNDRDVIPAEWML